MPLRFFGCFIFVGLAPLVLALLAGAAPPSETSLRLVEGRFDHALDARGGGFRAAADLRYGQRPLTIELWLQLHDVSSENVLLCNEAKNSGTHWELFVEKQTGCIGFRGNSFQPSVLVTKQRVATGRWRHISVVLEKTKLGIYLDGKPVLRQQLLITI